MIFLNVDGLNNRGLGNASGKSSGVGETALTCGNLVFASSSCVARENILPCASADEVFAGANLSAATGLSASDVGGNVLLNGLKSMLLGNVGKVLALAFL